MVRVAQRQQIEDPVFLAGEVQRLVVHLHRAGIQVHLELAGLNDRIGMTLGAAHNRLDAGDELALVEGLGQIVVGTDAETLDLVVQPGQP